MKNGNGISALFAKARLHLPLMKRISNAILICLLLLFLWRFRNTLILAFFTSFQAGWAILGLPVLFLIWNGLATTGWRKLLQATNRNGNQNFWQLYSARIQCQALNLILPLCGLGGEALRSMKTVRTGGLQNSILCVAVDKMVDVVAEMALALLGLIVAARLLPLANLTTILSVSFIVAIGMVFIWWKDVWAGIHSLWPLQRGREMLLALSVDRALAEASRKACVYHLLEHVLMAVEILFVANLLGIDLGLREILIVNAISSVFNLLFVFIPGRVGAYECSLAFAFNLLTLPASAGVSVALIRRARQVLVCLVGIGLFMIEKRKSSQCAPGDSLGTVAESQC